MSEPMLEVSGLNAWYGAAHILFDLSFRIEPGEVVALMGRNGAGKSTTIKALMALIARRSGTVCFCGEDISTLPAVRDRPARARLRARGSPDLLRPDSAGKPRHRPAAAAPLPDGRPAPSWTPEKLFAIFPNLGRMTDRLGAHMSGGEQQMLTVARTLMGNPLLVALDEPSEGVAPVIVEEMAETIIKLKKQGLSVLLSEQNIHFAELVSDRAYVLEKGQLQWEGRMTDLVHDSAAQRSYLSV